MTLKKYILIFCFLSYDVYAEDNDLLKSYPSFHALSFPNKKDTEYRYQLGELSFTVKNSASALIASLAQPCLVKEVRLSYSKAAGPSVSDSLREESKSGDDSFFRLGLLVSGKPPVIPFLAPSWIKKLGTMLSHPTDRMIYLWPDAKHRRGETWLSPYTGSIANIVMNSDGSASSGWNQARYRLPVPQRVVGFWLMADGDDTRSEFSGKVKDILIISDERCIVANREGSHDK